VPEFPIESPIEISRRLEIRGKDSSSWIAILNSAIGTPVILDALRQDLSSLLQTNTRTLSLHDSNFEQLRTEMHEPSDDVVLLIATVELPPEKWSALDLMRSALERRGPIILWLSPDAFASLSESAPNIRSFIGPSIFVAGPDGGIMTEEERQNRLKDLAFHYRQSNEDVLHKAELGELPPEPHFVEWLVLLGRGDLV
jgi:hypothetical protein